MYESTTIGECRSKLSVKGKHDSWVHAHVRAFNRSWNAKLTRLPCANCGYDKHVELCHINDVADFSDDVPLSVVNSIDNIIQLCRNCHWELGNELIFKGLSNRWDILNYIELARPAGVEPASCQLEVG